MNRFDAASVELVDALWIYLDRDRKKTLRLVDKAWSAAINSRVKTLRAITAEEVTEAALQAAALKWGGVENLEITLRHGDDAGVLTKENLIGIFPRASVSSILLWVSAILTGCSDHIYLQTFLVHLTTSLTDPVLYTTMAMYTMQNITMQPLLCMQECNLRATLQGHTDTVCTVTVSHDGKIAISAAQDQTLRIWSLETNLQMGILTGHETMVRADVCT